MTSHKKILIVDDEKHILDFYGTVLTKSDYQCICVQSAEAALEVIANNEIDVIVTDYKMPNMNGIELLEEVMELKPAMRRIMITGDYGTSDQMMSVLDNELAHRILSKPCSMSDFLEAISEQVALIGEDAAG